MLVYYENIDGKSNKVTEINEKIAQIKALELPVYMLSIVPQKAANQSEEGKASSAVDTNTAGNTINTTEAKDEDTALNDPVTLKYGDTLSVPENDYVICLVSKDYSYWLSQNGWVDDFDNLQYSDLFADFSLPATMFIHTNLVKIEGYPFNDEDVANTDITETYFTAWVYKTTSDDGKTYNCIEISDGSETEYGK